MGITVYPRLGKLLRERDLRPKMLERQIRERYGLKFDPKTLYRLTRDTPVERAHMEVAGAAAAILGVSLDEIFEVKANHVDTADDDTRFGLPPDKARRLADLFDHAAERMLTPDELAEQEALVAEYERRLYDRKLRELAEKRGVALDELRSQVEGEVGKARAWLADETASSGVATPPNGIGTSSERQAATTSASRRITTNGTAHRRRPKRSSR